jgi:hypothetical protein
MHAASSHVDAPSATMVSDLSNDELRIAISILAAAPASPANAPGRV